MTLAFLRDRDEVGTPSTQAIRWLLEMGVGIEAIGDFGAPAHTAFTVGATRVSFEPTGRYVPLPAMGAFAYILPAITGDGITDLVAWQPRNGRVAARLGIAGLIGENEAEVAAYDITARPLNVWRNPLGWLRAGRTGVVIVDPGIAAHLLSDLNVIPEDEELGRALKLLRVPPPRVLRSQAFSIQKRLAA